MGWWRHFLNVLLTTALICSVIAAVAIIYGTLALSISYSGIGHLVGAVGGIELENQFEKAIDVTSNRSARKVDANFERFNAMTDNENIDNWILACHGVKSKYDLTDALQSQFQLGLVSYWSGGGGGKQDFALKPVEHELLALSKSLSNQRVELRDKADAAYQFWEVSSVVTIVLGMLTTILISVSTAKIWAEDGIAQKSIRVLAIVFPALGTATAAVIAFYGPQVEWSQASRTLASLAQLQGEMSVGIWRYPCLPDSAEEAAKGPVVKALEDWSKRYLDVATVSAASGAAASADGSHPAPSPSPSASP